MTTQHAADDDENALPLFTATTTSARQLLALLKCVGFDSKATLQISAEGIRVTVEDTRVMQAHVFIYASLFTTYTFHAPAPSPASPPTTPTSSPTPDEDPTTTFALSLPSLLSALSLFPDPKPTTSTQTPGYTSNPVFDPSLLRLPPSLHLSYPAAHAPLVLTLTDGTLTTTAELSTFTPTPTADIPLSRLQLRLIMPSAFLHDAITELSSTSASSGALHIRCSEVKAERASAKKIKFAVDGDTGETEVEFTGSAMESWSFVGEGEVGWRYEFRLVKRAVAAMALGTKVSVRVDEEGVCSLQFMVDGEGGRAFVDFRVLPLLGEGEMED